MASFTDQKSSSNQVPEPEINPLQDPLLSRNLGRWAQVYFGAPPAERDAAVRVLLRALREDAASSPTLPNETEGIVCPVCQGYNPLSQRFCGFCGLLLKSGQSSLSAAEAAQESAYSSGPRESPSNLDELRELSFSTIYGDDQPESNGWKYFALVVVVLSGLAVAVYLQWGTSIRAMIEKPPAAVTAANTTPAPPAQLTPPASEEPNASGQDPSASAQTPEPAVTDIGSSPNDATHPESAAETNPANPQPDDPSANVAAANDNSPAKNAAVKPASKTEQISRSAPMTKPVPAKAQPPADNGSQELQVAQQYLDGSNGSRHPAQAAQWLWKAVAKKNSTALVLLSNLYMKGDGVPKSCDQARILLVAAAKNGAPNVGPQLRNLEQNGCR